MTTVDVLLRVEPDLQPLLLEGDRTSAGHFVAKCASHGLTVRVLRGRRMRTLPGLFGEFAAALQFPLYFGHNKDAFDECLVDLSWVPAGTGYVVVVFAEPDQVLADEDTRALAWLAGTLQEAAVAWSQAVEDGEWWDRPPAPFHVILAGDGPSLQAATTRWTGTGCRPAHRP